MGGKRRIPVAAMGTYYVPKAVNAAPDASSMRGLFYLVKNNREKPIPNWLNYPGHPLRAQQLENQTDAIEYFGAWLEPRFDRMLKKMGLSRPVRFVPIPSSDAIQGAENPRWPALDIAYHLEELGLGKASQQFINKRKKTPKNAGGHQSVEDLWDNLLAVDTNIPKSTIIYVDDSLTRGSHLVAMDIALGSPAKVGGLVVVATDSAYRETAQKARLRWVEYEIKDHEWPDRVRVTDDGE